MSTSQNHTAAPARGDARHQLERLYREIGISAVAAAVAQVRRPAEVQPVRRELPACLREDVAA